MGKKSAKICPAFRTCRERLLLLARWPGKLQNRLNSERPDGLSELELEQYNLVLEEQAYPFEEKAIIVHEKNIELLSIGVYNKWIDKSIAKLAVLMPARYAKAEQENTFVKSLKPSSGQAASAGNKEEEKAKDVTAMIGG